MRFQVPQFTDIEDKIIGPLTLKQFIYLGGAGGICTVIYFLMPVKILAFILMIPVAIFGFLLAFYKVNNKPFIYIVEAFFKYSLASKLYIWKKEPRVKKKNETEPKKEKQQESVKLTRTRIRELSRKLDTEDNNNK